MSSLLYVTVSFVFVGYCWGRKSQILQNNIRNVNPTSFVFVLSHCKAGPNGVLKINAKLTNGFFVFIIVLSKEHPPNGKEKNLTDINHPLLGIFSNQNSWLDCQYSIHISFATNFEQHLQTEQCPQDRLSEHDAPLLLQHGRRNLNEQLQSHVSMNSPKDPFSRLTSSKRKW
jgi:hypothetical protein